MKHNFVTNTEINSTVYTYVLLDVLLCNIAEYFASCAVFWRARRASQYTNNESKLSAILQNKTSNKRFIIQHAKLVFLGANFVDIYLQGMRNSSMRKRGITALKC